MRLGKEKAAEGVGGVVDGEADEKEGLTAQLDPRVCFGSKRSSWTVGARTDGSGSVIKGPNPVRFRPILLYSKTGRIRFLQIWTRSGPCDLHDKKS